MTRSRLNFLPFAVCLIAMAGSAPSRRNNGPDLIYDQKQTGDYNIQLHLKDFQVIAIMGDADGTLGDYDYSYDYSDLTIKPPAGGSTTTSSTTRNTLASSSSTTSTSTSSTTISTTTPAQSTSSPPHKIHHHSSTVQILPSPTVKPTADENSNQQPDVSSDLTKTNNTKHNSGFSNEISPSIAGSNDTSASLIGSAISNLLSYVSSTMKPSASTEEPLSMTPGKIKVQILASNGDASTTHTGIVPGEDIGGDVVQNEGDLLKRCALGYSRDKKGRCRRVRRPAYSPQLPFGFSRLASNLASRLRLSPSQLSLPSADNA